MTDTHENLDHDLDRLSDDGAPPPETEQPVLCACGHPTETHDGGGYCGVQFSDTDDRGSGFCGCDGFVQGEQPPPPLTPEMLAAHHSEIDAALAGLGGIALLPATREAWAEKIDRELDNEYLPYGLKELQPESPTK